MPNTSPGESRVHDLTDCSHLCAVWSPSSVLAGAQLQLPRQHYVHMPEIMYINIVCTHAWNRVHKHHLYTWLLSYTLLVMYTCLQSYTHQVLYTCLKSLHAHDLYTHSKSTTLIYLSAWSFPNFYTFWYLYYFKLLFLINYCHRIFYIRLFPGFPHCKSYAWCYYTSQIVSTLFIFYIYIFISWTSAISIPSIAIYSLSA